MSLRMLWVHFRIQLLIGLRDPTYFTMTILLPAGLYAFFALPESQNDYIASILIGSFSSFAFLGVLFFQHSVAVSQESISPWSHYLETLPVRFGVRFLARWLAGALFGALSSLAIYAIGRYATPTELTLYDMGLMIGMLIVGGLPLMLLGQLCGSLTTPRAIVPVGNFLYLTLSFVGGLWKPLELLPPSIAQFTPYLPSYHYGCLVWSYISPDNPLTLANTSYLIGFACCVALVLVWQQQRQLRNGVTC